MRETVEVQGADDALAKLKGLPKTANQALREKARAIVDEETPRLVAAGKSSDRQSRMVASAIRTRADRFPTIVAGGSKKLTPSRKIHRSRTQRTKTGRGKLVKPEAGQVFFGAEFGGRKRKTTQQFRTHQGRTGYWFWPTLRADEDRIGRRWLEAVDQVVEEANR